MSQASCGKAIRNPFFRYYKQSGFTDRKPQNQHGKVLGGVVGHWEPGSQAPPLRHSPFFLRRSATQTLSCAKIKDRTNRTENPSGRSLWVISCQSLCRLEAPVNDKATEKRHWPGPGTTRGQGKWCLGAPTQHVIPHRNLLQGPVRGRGQLCYCS